jgi:hypothetical protein
MQSLRPRELRPKPLSDLRSFRPISRGFKEGCTSISIEGSEIQFEPESAAFSKRKGFEMSSSEFQQTLTKVSRESSAHHEEVYASKSGPFHPDALSWALTLAWTRPKNVYPVILIESNGQTLELRVPVSIQKVDRRTRIEIQVPLFPFNEPPIFIEYLDRQYFVERYERVETGLWWLWTDTAT